MKPFNLWDFLALCWLDIERRAVIQRVADLNARMCGPWRRS